MAPSAIDIHQDYTPNQVGAFTGSSVTNHSNEHIQANGCARRLVEDALRSKVAVVDGDTCEADEEDTFFVADLGEVYRQHLRWKLNLPRVKPHYAIKCNPDAQVVRLLAELGTGFDCASKAEIEQVLKAGVDPSRIIYAQPCKTKSYVRYAEQQGVRQMTFDNADELYKIKQFSPNAELYLRILTDDSASLCRLSLKFGASLDSTMSLLKLARTLDLNVVGVAFHVGSGASDSNAFLKAVSDARVVFDQAEAVGYELKNLDVGGGFVSNTFEDMAAVLSNALEEMFPPQIRIIGEPGRFYVSSAFTIACHVIARRTVDDPDLSTRSYMLYLNDGVYGNFSSIMFDHQHPVPRILRCNGEFFGASPRQEETEQGIEYSIWGPTCDGNDCISTSSLFPKVLDIGDWLFFEDMGAYTKCSATRFNGFTDGHEVKYVSSEPHVSAMLRLEGGY
ncbi:MAG: Ornithine decarboxylase [Chrysothrix sp. TS-e1954]|nr:MAG: Ornithine decarboxylase [Chrysothrix sp. TS-e1954]